MFIAPLLSFVVRKVFRGYSELVGRVATYLDVFRGDLSNLVVSLGCAALPTSKNIDWGTYKTYLDSVRTSVLTAESYIS